MGVKGLWRLLLPIGRRISIEVLEGKILAIDASIWLTQFLKAMRDPDTGSVKPAAHLIGFFRRLAKLRFHGIRPVLVFDGATPIIKQREIAQRRQRREQFAPTTDGTVQRLAKRLLIQEIKRSELMKASSEGAQAHGFNLPHDEPNQLASARLKQDDSDHDLYATPKKTLIAQTSEKVALVLQEQEWQQQVESDYVINGGGSLETSEEIARALQEEEWQEEQEINRQEDVPSDWDALVPDETVCNIPEHTEQKAKRLRVRERDDECNFDVEYLSSLPPHARKSFVEEALRRQRLNSRKEFMPVAGRPAEYSQVQLRNFLRSTQLNKSIVKMGQRTAIQHATEGEKIASDPSRRFIFEKSDGKPKQKGLRMLIQHHGSNDDTDPDDSWADESHAKRSHDASSSNHPTITKVVSRKKMVILDSSDDDDTQGDNRKTPFGAPAEIKNDMSNLDSSAPSDDSSEGGFLKDDLENSNIRAGQQVEQQQHVGSFSRPLSLDDKSYTTNPRDLEKDRASEIPIVAGLLNESISPDTNNDADSDDDDVVEWEDGEALSNSENDHDVWDSDDGVNKLGKLVEPEISRNRHFNDFSDKALETRNLSALHQAQETAANLTDWAGRAFRRAVAEHEQDNLKKKPSPDKGMNPELADPLVVRANVVETVEFDSEEEVQTEFFAHFVEGDEIKVQEGRQVDNDVVMARRKSSIFPVIEVRDDSKQEERKHPPSIEKDIHRGHLPHQFSERERIDNCLGHTNEIDNALVQVVAGSAMLSSATKELMAQEDQLNAEHKRHARDMETVNDEMKSEIISLIQLFGIPYVESPAEAEAQCVVLEGLGLVDGIVTEDSDVFVFGGKTIYRNMFDDQKFLEVYRAEDAMTEMSLGKDQMVAMAMLLGGDYTEGVKGVGIVNAMEILEAFPMSAGVKNGLQEFRKWLDGFDPSDAKGSLPGIDDALEGLTAQQKFHLAHRSARLRWVCPPHFPAENVLNAYLNPVVDTSNKRFSWGTPDADELAKFCARYMGWEASETMRMLDPVMKRIDSGMRQTRMDTFMRYSDNIQFANVRSKRLRSVFEGVRKENPDVS